MLSMLRLLTLVCVCAGVVAAVQPNEGGSAARLAQPSIRPTAKPRATPASPTPTTPPTASPAVPDATTLLAASPFSGQGISGGQLNVGQFPPDVLFTESVWTLTKQRTMLAFPDVRAGDTSVSTVVAKVFDQINATVAVTSTEKPSAYASYFHGNDPAKWPCGYRSTGMSLTKTYTPALIFGPMEYY